MIIREWRGRAATASGEAEPEHFRASVLPELLQVPGFLGAHLSQLEDRIEFLVLTRWQSIEAIRGFAGSDISKAVVEPAAAAALLDFDASVQHYDVIEEAHIRSQSKADKSEGTVRRLA
jgi:heme-degrading monooxygenase HmoA